jgi:hypothetical protein
VNEVNKVIKSSFFILGCFWIVVLFGTQIGEILKIYIISLICVVFIGTLTN